MSEHQAAKIAPILIGRDGRQVKLGRLLRSYEGPTIMAAADNVQADISAAITAASGTAPPSAADPHAAPLWLTGGAPAAAPQVGR